MNWIEQKNRIFNEIYLKTFSENGFKKRGWEFYKVIEPNKFAVTVKIHSSGYNDIMGAAFWVLIGLKFNKDYPEKLRMSEITLDKCEVLFSIIRLLYPQETVRMGEYWYRIGHDYAGRDELGKEIGSKHEWNSHIHCTHEYIKKHIRERISDKYIKYTNQELDMDGRLLNQEEYIALNTGDRYDYVNIAEIFSVITKDTDKIIHFINACGNFENFMKTDTQDILPNDIKNEIVENYSKMI
jgi:hypothetical protein